jgi:hypothetical protein
MKTWRMSRFYYTLGFIWMSMTPINAAPPAEESADPLQAQVESGLRAKDGKQGDTKRYTIAERMRHHPMVGAGMRASKVSWSDSWRPGRALRCW